MLHESIRDYCREFSAVAGLHEKTDITYYKTTNWAAYNEALTVWFDPKMN